MKLPTPDKLNFLIVDDMDNMRRSIRAMLKLIQFGRTISEAADGMEAWKLLESTEEEIHFIISDWNMPRMSGTELLNLVRANTKFRDIPFLMITAEANKEVVAEAAENEVDAYLTKPFVTATLEKKITELLGKANNPDPATILLYRARALEESGDIDSAIAHASKACECNPRSSLPLRALGRLYLRKNNINQAKDCFTQAVSLNQLDVTSFHFLGQIHYKIGEVDRAIDFFSRAMDISPRHSDRALKFATLLAKKNQPKQAERIFALALRNNAFNLELQEDIVGRCMAGGLFDMAIKVLRELLRRDPNRHHLTRQLGIALHQKGNDKEAISFLEAAAEKFGDDIPLLLALGETYLDLGKPIPAEKWIIKVIRIDPENALAKDLLARCD